MSKAIRIKAPETSWILLATFQSTKIARFLFLFNLKEPPVVESSQDKLSNSQVSGLVFTLNAPMNASTNIGLTSLSTFHHLKHMHIKIKRTLLCCNGAKAKMDIRNDAS